MGAAVMRVGSSSTSFAVALFPPGVAGAGVADRIASAGPHSTRRTSPPSASDIGLLAVDLNISTASLRGHLTSGGLLSFTVDARGIMSPSGDASDLRGLPLDEWGTPDFDAIKAAGGTVTGTMPPNGGCKMIELCDGHRTVYYSAQIEFPDGRTRYVRGMAHESDGSATASATFKSLPDALGFVRGLPGSMEEARQRIGEYNNGLRSTVDFAM